jgi:hypothetical protein
MAVCGDFVTPKPLRAYNGLTSRYVLLGVRRWHPG